MRLLPVTVGGRAFVVRQHDDGTFEMPPELAALKGRNVALKPGHEPICVARKPLASTVAATVLRHGTGALNIDGCRVEGPAWTFTHGPKTGRTGGGIMGDPAPRVGTAESHPAGRWPTNVVLSHVPILDEHGEPDGDACVEGCVPGCPVAELDAQSGITTSRAAQPRSGRKGDGWRTTATGSEYNDDGGASRFFPAFRYEAKADSSERPRVGGVAHPTVKPVALMAWLVRLVTQPGGLILDQFAGSGATLEAAMLEGFDSIAVEQDPAHLPLIQHRIDRARRRAQPGIARLRAAKPAVRPLGNQPSLFDAAGV